MLHDDNGFLSKMFIEPLNDINWETWSFLIEQCLTVNDLWDIVTGTETETEPTETTKKGKILRRQKSARAHIALDSCTPRNRPQEDLG